MRPRASLLVLAALLVLPVSTAHAAARPALGCLRAGGPGTLTVVQADRGGTSQFELFAAGLGGLKELTRTPLGGGCGDSATGGDTTALIAIDHDKADEQHMRVVMRHGDGAFGTPVEVAHIAPDDAVATTPRIAVGPNGDVAVAWVEYVGQPFTDSGEQAVRIVAARRPAGGSFTVPRTVAKLPYDGFLDGTPPVRVGVDAAGATTVVWSRPLPTDDTTEYGDAALETASAPRAGGFGDVSQLSGRVEGFDSFALAVAPGGGALVAWTGTGGLATAERPSATSPFAAAQEIVSTATPSHVDGRPYSPTVALAPDGGAVIAWESFDGDRLAVGATSRAAGQPLAAPRQIWSEPLPGYRAGGAVIIEAGNAGGTAGGSAFFEISHGPNAPYEDVPPRASIAPDGQVTLTWLLPRRFRGDQIPTAWSASGTLATGFGTARQASGNCRAATGLTPFTGDAGPLIAWLDDAGSAVGIPYELFGGDGRVHVQTPDHVLPTTGSPIKLDATAPGGTQSVYQDDPVNVGASCDRACDVRAWIPGAAGQLPKAATGKTLRRGGRTRMSLSTITGEPLAPSRPGPVRVRVRACDADGAVVADTSVAVRLARHPVPPLVKLRDVEARRSGGDVIVTWTTDRNAKRQTFYVTGLKRRQPRSTDDYEELGQIEPPRSGRRHFRLRARSSDAKYVIVDVAARDAPYRERSRTVRVSRP